MGEEIKDINDLNESSEDNVKNDSPEKENGEIKEENGTEEVLPDAKKELKELEEKAKKSDEYYAMLQRMAAEFDNFKKRTVKEKEMIYQNAVSDVISAFLPVVYNFERALKSIADDCSSSVKDGLEMVFRQMKDTLKNVDVEEIICVGEKFDPNLHNALMHIEDDSYGENEIVEEFQKGYKYKEKVIRHSGVKVAN
jgi:molecular chaperone GrpE